MISKAPRPETPSGQTIQPNQKSSQCNKLWHQPRGNFARLFCTDSRSMRVDLSITAGKPHELRHQTVAHRRCGIQVRG
jgi:hypothetical protein